MFWAWLGALLVGISLGLLGSGGSILTVPVLVYLVDEPEKLAIAESLGIVGTISLAGAIPYAIKNRVHWRSVLYFGLPGMAGTYGGAFLAKYVSGTLQLVVFAFVMIIAAIMMYRNHATLESSYGDYPRYKIILEGIGVGVLTGFVGVGGGFLIVPALVLMEGLPITLAVGTSLVIISMKSFSGFYKYLDVLQSFDLSVNWSLLVIFSGIGILGSLAGKKIGDQVSQEGLKKGFALFLALMGAYIIYMNL
ncbi:sulfite exporter TauE/SafE family protein [Aliifodinibius sp. S!AR15-10]|uniref:sulfite exporter TauE/SafE family protein n=1 Tax=Aliifodinibius sp. S!AR15-10 TaxID=2950437 RepID=UPI0028644781|nr:sulfite exporter TauE/SafE family protein [Aliifodinibius sp. S!AR15-10]MDR8391671.1 sulfite exporter TauE/SafE family protein [Aliifodinibius sp. S!AR15-10]